jgi:hypothetical protein
MTRPFAWATAMAFLALGSLSVYASDTDEPLPPVPELQLPQFVAAGDDFYPASAVRNLTQGSVGVEFQIDDKGHVQDLAATFADNADFATSATEYLSKGRFRIPEDWVQNGGPGYRFAVEVQFLIGRGDAGCARKPPRIADTAVVTVCRMQPRRKTRL